MPRMRSSLVMASSRRLRGLHHLLAFFGLIPEVRGGDLGFAFG